MTPEDAIPYARDQLLDAIASHAEYSQYSETGWERDHAIDRAAKWATVVMALGPPPPEPVDRTEWRVRRRDGSVALGELVAICHTRHSAEAYIAEAGGPDKFQLNVWTPGLGESTVAQI